jgi:hypothetical protein
MYAFNEDNIMALFGKVIRSGRTDNTAADHDVRCSAR